MHVRGGSERFGVHEKGKDGAGEWRFRPPILTTYQLVKVIGNPGGYNNRGGRDGKS
jgi:hypothetical protein